jgi:hypothetical protein
MYSKIIIEDHLEMYDLCLIDGFGLEKIIVVVSRFYTVCSPAKRLSKLGK